MPNTPRKADAFITIEVDVLDGCAVVIGYLRRRADPELQTRSFSCLVGDAGLLRLLPEWLAELRAEAELGRVETLIDQRERLDGSSVGAATTEITSLNSTCTSLGPDTGPRSLIR